MSLLIGEPHIQYCEKCGWKNEYIIQSDCLHISHCPKCDNELTLKAIRELSFFEKIKLELNKFIK